MAFYTYIMTNAPYGTIYIGHTDDLVRRAYEHREHVVEGFTKKYELDRLVWYELHATRENALVREKQLKTWRRQWKIELIEAKNSRWDDLYPSLL